MINAEEMHLMAISENKKKKNLATENLLAYIEKEIFERSKRGYLSFNIIISPYVYSKEVRLAVKELLEYHGYQLRKETGSLYKISW